MLTIKQLMAKYNICRQTVYNLIKKGMPSTKIGRALRFDPDKVQEWLDNQNNKKEE